MNNDMGKILYIMVTNWARHWDDLKERWGNSTLFTLPMIKDGINRSPFPSEATTLFIKLAKDGKFERSWLGVSKNFQRDPNKGKEAIRFEVADLQETSCPTQFRNYSIGWHLNKANVTVDFTGMPESGNESLLPRFFNEMQTCGWETFEKHCHHLLRIIGIHDIHAIPQKAQQGKADGFFLFHSLSVIYDASLDPNFEVNKEQQIENYVNQLRKPTIEDAGYSYTIQGTQRQVWLITRGHAVRKLKEEDHIKVKEVPYTKIVEVYKRRLLEPLGTEDLVDVLKNLK